MDHTEIINDNSEVTANSKQLELLKTHFPQCFDKDGNFIMQKMQEVVSDEGLELSKESYSLNWLGKSYARLLANENPLTLLKEDKEHNAKEQNSTSQNVLIKGDNLEVLKHLSNSYNEAIKMIYIDPPYNTGGDGFVYQDDRKFTAEELSHLAGVEIEEAKHILEFTQSKANSHSAWLTFMYPRLYVARHLLKEDGVIFISIDDNEAGQLKLLCDEVFGEENFVDNIIWKKRYGGGAKEKFLVTLHEYTLFYAKDIQKLPDLFVPLSEESIKRYYKSKDSNFEIRGPYRTHPLEAGKAVDERPNLVFDIEAPDGTIIKPKRQWYWNKERVVEAISNNELEFKKDKDKNLTVHTKQYLKDENGIMRQAKTFSMIEDIYSQHGTNEILDLFGNAKIFSYPKPSKLIKTYLEVGMDMNGIVLDFFAGSGTTAHAVMELNTQDGGNRKYITAQLGENTDSKSEAYKAGYKTIFEITKARIEKAAIKISEENPDFTGDLGFKVFETVPVFDGYLDDIETLDDETTLFDGSSLSDDELETLLTTWRVYDGMRLGDAVEEVALNDYKAYLGNGSVYMMNAGFTAEELKAFIKKLDEDAAFEPSKVVLFGYNFASKHQREFKEALASYMNRKSIELDLIVRY